MKVVMRWSVHPVLLRLRSCAVGSYPAGWAAKRRTVGSLATRGVAEDRSLARLLQQVVNDGTLSEGQINQKSNHGNLAGLVDDLNPEAMQLLDDISTSLRANHSEEPLGLLSGRRSN